MESAAELDSGLAKRLIACGVALANEPDGIDDQLRGDLADILALSIAG